MAPPPNADLIVTPSCKTQLPHVAILIYPGISPFHFAVPYALFNTPLDGERLFHLALLSTTGSDIQAGPAVSIHADGTFEQLAQYDMVIIPGWADIAVAPTPALTAVLQQAHANGTHLVGLCYGAYALAYAGLLDARSATTHWLASDDFLRRFPGVKLNSHALYIETDNLTTSAGTAAALDCCLNLVRRYHGGHVANQLARLMVVSPHREGDQAQFIQQPVATTTQDSRINQLLDYLHQHLASSQRIDHLAARCAMSRRSFTRHFFMATGKSLTRWLIDARLQQSCTLLENSHMSIDEIAECVGFANTRLFRHHFKLRFSLSPQAWRQTFRATE